MDTQTLEQFALYYLGRLPDDADAWHALAEADPNIVPILIKAFRAEQDARVRAQILEAIGNYRDPASIACFSEALGDPAPSVWKQALDGLVALDRPECVAAIESARGRQFLRKEDAVDFRRWVDEAVDQLRRGFFGEKDIK
jgi:hypothetical protein